MVTMVTIITGDEVTVRRGLLISESLLICETIQNFVFVPLYKHFLCFQSIIITLRPARTLMLRGICYDSIRTYYLLWSTPSKITIVI